MAPRKPFEIGIAGTCHDANGYEIPDPTPIEVPVQLNKQLTLDEIVARSVQSVLNDLKETGTETLEDDEEPIDDDDIITPFEDRFDKQFPGIGQMTKEIESGFRQVPKTKSVNELQTRLTSLQKQMKEMQKLMAKGEQPAADKADKV